MSEMGDDFREHRDYMWARRATYGVNCPGCQKVQPKRTPTILLPQQQCKVCGYTDPRPRTSAPHDN